MRKNQTTEFDEPQISLKDRMLRTRKITDEIDKQNAEKEKEVDEKLNELSEQSSTKTNIHTKYEQATSSGTKIPDEVTVPTENTNAQTEHTISVTPTPNGNAPISVEIPSSKAGESININISLDGLNTNSNVSNAPLKRQTASNEEVMRDYEEYAEQEKEKPAWKIVMGKVISFTLTLAIIIGVVFLLKLFVVSIVPLKGDSMHPNYRAGDKLIVERVSYYIGDPKTNDVVCIKLDNGVKLIKRVVGVPGDTIQIINGVLYRNDEPIDEKYGKISNPGIAVKKITLGYDEYFLMGDNREDSQDSRNFGPVDKDKIIGKVVGRIWPWGSRSNAKTEKEAIEGI